MAVSAVIGAFTNTALVMGMIFLAFRQAYAAMNGVPVDAVLGIILGIVAGNGIPEAIVAAVITPAVALPLAQALHLDKTTLGTDAVSCMQSGAIYGAAAQIDGLTARVEELLGQPVTAVVTGGLSGLVCPYCRRAVFRDEHLLLRGLHLIYRGIRGSAAGQT